MPRISVRDLEDIKRENRTRFALKKGGYRAKVVVHMGTCGLASGASKIMTALRDEISGAGLEDVLVITAGCAGICAREPMATVETPDKPPVKYVDLDEKKMKEIFREHIMGGKPVEKYAMVLGCEAAY
jgi:NADP-reducing hydrogenase subunit HndB